MIASSILFGLAVIAYILFYIEYIPQIGIERVVHLQYGFVASSIMHRGIPIALDIVEC